MINKDEITIYTDGACDPNPGTGGWAAIVRTQKGEIVLSGCEPESTNNRMELTAAIAALEKVEPAAHIKLFTDSQYLQRGIQEWLPNWVKKNWKGSNGKVANQDLWKKLLDCTSGKRIEWHWLRGHIGNRENARVDLLAKKAIRNCN